MTQLKKKSVGFNGDESDVTLMNMLQLESWLPNKQNKGEFYVLSHPAVNVWMSAGNT